MLGARRSGWAVVLATVALIGVLLSGVILGLQYFHAGVDATLLELEAIALEGSRVVPPERARALRERAVAIAQALPWDPEAWDRVGRAALLEARHAATTPAQAIAAWRRAERALIRSLRLRPNWSHTWLNLAEAQAALDRRAPRWRTSVRQALRVDPRGPAIQLHLLRLRLDTEAVTDAELERLWDEALTFGLREDPGVVIGYLRRIDRGEWACRRPPPNTVVERFCRIEVTDVR